MKFKIILFLLICTCYAAYAENVFDEQLKWQHFHIKLAESYISSIQRNLADEDFGLIAKNCEGALQALYIARKPIDGLPKPGDIFYQYGGD